MINSVLSAQLVEARGLPYSDTGYVVLMETEGQRSTSDTSLSQIGEPVWNEILTFDINTGRDMIFIEI
jgi:hypothetical protein